MLRMLYDGHGMYFFDRGALADQVLGEERWFCCQGVLRLRGAWALRCQESGQLLFPDGTLGVRQQCGHLATRAPDGEALCAWHCQEAWFCYGCGARFATKYGDIRWEQSFCHRCAAEYFTCERCG